MSKFLKQKIKRKMYNLIYIFRLSKASLVYEKKLSCSKIQADILRMIVNADHFTIYLVTIDDQVGSRNTSFW